MIGIKKTNLLNLNLSPIQQFLCAGIVHRDYLNISRIIKLYNYIGDDTIYSQCKINNITPIVADSLNRAIGFDNIPVHWKQSYDTINKKIFAYMDELDTITYVLGKKNIPVVALKNSGITRALYPNYGACPMGDIDVLVKKSDFEMAHKILLQNGYTLKFRSPLESDNFDQALKSGGAEYFIQLNNGDKLWFELQWRPIAGRWISPKREPNSNDLLTRSLEIPNSYARILSPEDNLLQVCIHTAKHSYVRAPGFRLHTDVDRIVRYYNIDWRRFVDLVQIHFVKTAVFFSLALAKDFLNTPIPMFVLDKFRPSVWKLKLIRNSLLNVGLFNPDEKKWNKFTYIFFVAMLYDNTRELLHNIFPTKNSISEELDRRSLVSLPMYYIKRALTLIVKRNLN